jgi:5-formyltetrahydrofolate cyclo-ligase
MKEIIRKKLKYKREELSKNKVLENSLKIKERLFELDDFKNASYIMYYVSYDNEVYTHDMIKDCLKNNKNVIVPVSEKENKSLILSELNNWNDLKPGTYGILEPIKNRIKKVSKDIVDLIIVPGVGFDEKGRRIGHGKGYYDNLLKNSKNAKHIGLAFEFQILKEIPVDPHDVPVDKIITEKRLIICK